MPKSVLMVDDDPRIMAPLAIRLQAHGFVVYHAINGLAGVEAAALHRPDLVVMDYRMPDVDGIDACIRIRRLPCLQDTPVIILSASLNDTICRRALASGASLCLTKPYVAQEVVGQIAAMIDRTSQPKELRA
jgi:DNA-binding response OmpR family regulator